MESRLYGRGHVKAIINVSVIENVSFFRGWWPHGRTNKLNLPIFFMITLFKNFPFYELYQIKVANKGGQLSIRKSRVQ